MGNAGDGTPTGLADGFGSHCLTLKRVRLTNRAYSPLTDGSPVVCFSSKNKPLAFAASHRTTALFPND